MLKQRNNQPNTNLLNFCALIRCQHMNIALSACPSALINHFWSLFTHTMSDMPPPYTDQISPSEIQPKKVRDRKHRGCLLSVSQAHTPPHTCDISPDNSFLHPSICVFVLKWIACSCQRPHKDWCPGGSSWWGRVGKKEHVPVCVLWVLH